MYTIIILNVYHVPSRKSISMSLERAAVTFVPLLGSTSGADAKWPWEKGWIWLDFTGFTLWITIFYGISLDFNTMGFSKIF